MNKASSFYTWLVSFYAIFLLCQATSTTYSTFEAFQAASTIQFTETNGGITASSACAYQDCTSWTSTYSGITIKQQSNSILTGYNGCSVGLTMQQRGTPGTLVFTFSGSPATAFGVNAYSFLSGQWCVYSSSSVQITVNGIVYEVNSTTDFFGITSSTPFTTITFVHTSSSVPLLSIGEFYAGLNGPLCANGIVSTTPGVVGCSCCNSGYSGSTCSSSIGSSCLASAVVPGAYSTIAPTTLESASYVSDTLVLTVSAPIVQNRTCTTLSLGLNTSAVPACTAFTKSLVSASCTETWSTSVSWSTALASCGFGLTSSPGSAFNTYTGYLQVSGDDVLSGGTRVDKSVFPINVVFPAFLNATTVSVNVISDISIAAILSSQNYNPLNSQATLIFETTVLWPYILQSPSVIVPSSFVVVSFGDAGQDVCPQTTGSTCVQYWTLVETPKAGTCALTGNYNISLTPACRSSTVGTPSCPYATGETDIVDSFLLASIYSDNFCPTTQVQIQVTPYLNGVVSPGSVTTKSSYALNHLAYFVYSVVSTQAQVSALVLESVSVSGVGALYDLGSTTLGTELLFQENNIAEPSPAYLPFQFNLNPTVFSAGQIEVTASAQVYFSANGKRSITTVFSLSQLTSNQSIIVSITPDTDDSSASTTSLGNISTSGESDLVESSATPMTVCSTFILICVLLVALLG